MYSLTDYDYHLPADLIAQRPVTNRDQSRLMVLDRKAGAIWHARFSNLLERLRPGDLLVVNDTRVIPGRLLGRKETGGKIELLLLDYPGKESNGNGAPGLSQGQSEKTFQCLVRASRAPRPGTKIIFSDALSATVVGGENGLYSVVFTCLGDFEEALESAGQIPLPPYIKRPEESGSSFDDRAAYQTVYAANKGAVAAPTAGLHFSEALLSTLRHKGIKIVALTLHVGYGTFLPVRVNDIREHTIHSEWYRLGRSAASAVNKAKAEGRRVIAVGTTAVRVLEHQVDPDGRVQPGSGDCDLFIYPGFTFRIIDGMITNFHLPQSTLLMLVSAFAGREFILDAYRKAVGHHYRFYSYGDAMLIL